LKNFPEKIVLATGNVGKLKEMRVRNEDCHADAFYTEAEKAKLEEAS